MVHIDWLTVYEDHAQAPDWGETLRVDYDTETGELQREVMMGSQVEESWQTFLRVRSHGGRVEVSGNPSKWGRLDAVVGIETMGEAIEVYNGVLRQLGLPAFSESRTYCLQGADRPVCTGPRLSRVDLTGNLVLGDSAAVRPFLNWMAMQRWGRKGHAFAAHQAGTYIKAGSAQRRQLVFYDKAEELKQRASDWRRKRCEEKEAAVDYLKRLAEWAQGIGLVRRELRLGSKELSETGLCYVGNWGCEQVLSEYQKRVEIAAMNSDIGAYMNWTTDAKAAFVRAGSNEKHAATLVNWVLGWMSGNDPRDGLSRATFYRWRKEALTVLGVDLRNPPNVLTLGTRVRSMARVIEARPLTRAQLPDWYDRLALRRAA